MKNYPDRWSDLEPKRVLGISTKYMGGRNYFKEIKFYFSKNDLSDEKVLSYMKKVKFSLFFAVIFWFLAVFALIF